MKFAIGVICGLVLAPALVAAYLLSGWAPAAATDKPMPGEKWIANTALSKRLREESPTRDLSTMTTADLLAGADTYKKNCVACHGLPDQTSEIGRAMFPPAPEELKVSPPRNGQMSGSAPAPSSGPSPQSGMVKGRGPSGDFWRVKNGIRLTGMPSFEKTLSDDQMWQVVALLAKKRNLPPEVKAALTPDIAAGRENAENPPVTHKQSAPVFGHQ